MVEANPSNHDTKNNFTFAGLAGYLELLPPTCGPPRETLRITRGVDQVTTLGFEIRRRSRRCL